MKNSIMILAVLAIFGLYACGQTGKVVPEKIKTSFAQKFPEASKVKWDKENASEWEAEFMMGGKEYSANYSSAGEWMETEYEIEESEIPADVKANLEKEFSGCKITESEISETATGKVYEFELKISGEIMEVSMDLSGNVLKKEEAKENDKEDKD